MPTISFALHQLGWKAFEDLVSCILRHVMGQSFQSFAEGVDGGRDGAFHGQWTPQGGESLSGSFTVQCKHTSKSDKTLAKSVIKMELPKVARLAAQELADNYIFVTNHVLPAKREKDAKDAFLGAGAGKAFVYGPEWINATIAEHPTLRRLVPRLYGLGDLTQIVTHQAYRQAREVLDSLAPDLACFVPTAAYRKCAHALKEYGFVLLLGEPASGKTMIANLLALSAADEWNLQTLILSGPEDFTRLWDPDDPGQFLWVDDAFGAAQYDPIRVREWNQRLPMLKTAIHKGARVVFTSRDYIFKAAKSDLKISSFELFEDSRVTIRVENLAELERQMILYNHLKCGKQSREFRRAVKPWLAEAAATRKFLPEIARRFANPKFTKDFLPNAESVKDFFEKPLEWLEEVLTNLAAAEKAAIALVFIAGGRLPIPVPEDEGVLRTIATMRSNIGDVKAALNALDDSLIRRTKEDGRGYWRFRHPTVGDALASLVGSDPELIDIYLAGVSTKRLMREVTCGEMNLQGVKIVVPPERFSEVLEKLKTTGRKPLEYFDPVGIFLATRCSGGFLERYFTEVEPMASLPDQIRFLQTYDEALCLLCRLHVSALLPEEIRQATVKRVRHFATHWYSCEFMDEPIVRLLTAEERDALMAEIKDIVLSNEFEIVNELRSGWEGDGDPEELFSTVIQTLSLLEETEDEDESSQATNFLDEIRDVIAEMESERSASPGYRTLEAEETAVGAKPLANSIFDDVDE